MISLMHSNSSVGSTMLIRRILQITLYVVLTCSLFGSNKRALAADVRIAILVSASQAPFEQALAGLEQVFGKPGAEVEIDIYRLEGNPEKTASTIQKIKSTNVRLVITVGSMALDEALEELKEVPIISCMVLRPDHLKGSANATGVFLEFPLKTQFKWIQDLIPDAETIGVIYNPDENAERVKAASKLARKLGLQLEAYAVKHPKEMPAALESLSRKADVLWGLADRLVLAPQTAKGILLFSFRNRIPFVGLSAPWVEDGALYSLESDYKDIGKQCGEIAVKVLQGVSAGSISPATPRTVTYSLNLKTAKHMKIKIPKTMIRGARQIF